MFPNTAVTRRSASCAGRLCARGAVSLILLWPGFPAYAQDAQQTAPAQPTLRHMATVWENMETPRVTRPVARHRELSVPAHPMRMIGSPTTGTPRPTALAYDHG